MQAFGKAAQHQPYDQPMRGCDRPHIGPAKGIVCDDRGGDGQHLVMGGDAGHHVQMTVTFCQRQDLRIGPLHQEEIKVISGYGWRFRWCFEAADAFDTKSGRHRITDGKSGAQKGQGPGHDKAPCLIGGQRFRQMQGLAVVKRQVVFGGKDVDLVHMNRIGQAPFINKGAFGRRGGVIGVDGADRRPYLSTVRMAG